MGNRLHFKSDIQRRFGRLGSNRALNSISVLVIAETLNDLAPIY